MADTIGYALKGEDLLLAHALDDIAPQFGFYIDVGANDPVRESVTKILYDKGWHGINVEPSPYWYERLVADRHRDVNIHAAASDGEGSVTLFDDRQGGLGTSIEEYANRHRSLRNLEMIPVTVPTLSLTSICEQEAVPDTIHFLKIDVEGFEERVIRGMDFTRFRPWILCIEATEPLREDVPTHEDWEAMILAANYIFVWFDGWNRWYLSNEQNDRAKLFPSAPV